MSDAYKAYRAAQRLIAEALADGRDALDLDKQETHALTKLPPEISDLTEIKRLDLDNTQIASLAPIAVLTGIRMLRIDNTRVSNLTPVKNMTEIQTLSLDNTQVSEISAIAGLINIRTLRLDNTSISDLTPLAGMIGLKNLHLKNTKVSSISSLRYIEGINWLNLSQTLVSDIEPINGMKEINRLYLHDTMVSDLRPLLSLSNLRDYQGKITLHFQNTLATKLDPKLLELSEIEDDQERVTTTLDYLREVGDDWPPLPSSTPDQDTILTVTQTEDGRLDVSPANPDAEELTDAVKTKAHALLQQATKSLEQIAGNMHPRLSSSARTLWAHIDCPLQDVDMLDAHFELEALRGTYERRGERKGEDIFGDDVIDALDKVLMIGPGLVLDNEQVEELEARRDRYRGHVPDADTLAAQDALSDGIIEHPEAFGEHLRAYSEGFKAGSKQEMDRLRIGQNSANKNVVIVAGMYVVDGMLGGPLSAAGESIFTWLLAQSDTISVLAPTWGSAFEAWITPIMMRAKEARSGIQGVLKRPN